MIVHIKGKEMDRLQRLIPEIEIYAERILQTVHQAFLILSPDLRVMWANQWFYKTFQVGPGGTEGRLLFDLGNRQWDLPGLRALLGNVVRKGFEVHDYEVEQEFAGIGRRTMLLNANNLPSERNDPEMIPSL